MPRHAEINDVCGGHQVDVGWQAVVVDSRTLEQRCDELLALFRGQSVDLGDEPFNHWRHGTNVLFSHTNHDAVGSEV